jgi:hypothetical protein
MAGKHVTPIPSNLGTIQPATRVLPGTESISDLQFKNSQYAAGGAGLRNRNTACIQINGLNKASATAAVMYYAIITEGPAPANFAMVTLTNEQTKTSLTFVGEIIGTGASPCWPGDTITVYRALVDPAKLGA